jgi:hypothetical protein
MNHRKKDSIRRKFSEQKDGGCVKEDIIQLTKDMLGFGFEV